MDTPPKEQKLGKYTDIITSMDEENKKCVDCNKENPDKVSINNGVLICETCAEQHKQLGTMISYIRDLNDEFDEYLLNFLTLGSNSKFKRFLAEEHVDESLPIEKKYATKACDYYRRILKQKVKGEKLAEKDYENPNEIIEHPENYFPEFEDYQLKKSTGGETKAQQAKKVLSNIGAGLFGFGKKVYSGVKQGANFVATKAQPAAQQVKKGAAFAGKKMGSAYSGLKNKIVSLNKGPAQKNQPEGAGENPPEAGKEENKENNDVPKANEENPDTGALANQPLPEGSQEKKEEEKAE